MFPNGMRSVIWKHKEVRAVNNLAGWRYAIGRYVLVQTKEVVERVVQITKVVGFYVENTRACEHLSHGFYVFRMTPCVVYVDFHFTIMMSNV